VIVRLSADQRAQLAREARAAFPRECCGLVEGRRGERGVDITALHPCRNVAPGLDAFEIDPAEQFRLLRALRGTDRAIIGCYHSHPNGTPEPSPRDVAAAGEEGFLWLIVAVDAGTVSVGAHKWDAGRFVSISISSGE